MDDVGRTTYAEQYGGWVAATVTYFQVSLPALNPTDFAAHPRPLARALSGVMKAPEDEQARPALFGQATAGALTALREGALSEDAVAALWTLIHHALPRVREKSSGERGRALRCSPVPDRTRGRAGGPRSPSARLSSPRPDFSRALTPCPIGLKRRRSTRWTGAKRT